MFRACQRRPDEWLDCEYATTRPAAVAGAASLLTEGDVKPGRPCARIADSARRPGQLSGVTGGMQIILYAQPWEACGAGEGPCGSEGGAGECHSFGWCLVLRGRHQAEGKDHAGLRYGSDRGTGTAPGSRLGRGGS